MTYIFKSKKVSMSIFLLVLLFVDIKSTIEDWNITELDNKKEFSDNKELKIISKFQNPSNYLKIEMITESKDTQFIFSFYKESSLNNRTQLAQSISGKAFLYLTKEEFTNEFYIKTEFDGSPSKYNLSFTQKEILELSIGEQYTYYITKENKNMNFKLVGTPLITYDKVSIHSYNTPRLSIWAKGSLDLSTTLSIDEKVHTKKTKNLYSYIVELSNDTNPINYDFNISGTEGDLIKIGVVLFSKKCYCQTVVTDQNMEIIGFLKKGILDHALILFSKSLSFAYEKFNDYESSIMQNIPASFDYDNGIEVKDYSFSGQNIEEKFYLMEFKKNISNQNYIYPLQARIGATYTISMGKDEISSLLPMKTDSAFITYQVWAEYGTYKANILNCQNYPFCKNENNLTPLWEYNSASASYSSSEYGKISPIQSNQKVLLLKCDSIECKINVNIYTEKNNIYIYQSVPMYKYIRAGNEDNLIIDSLEQDNNYCIYLQILTELSSATVTFEGKNYTKDNMILYEFKALQNKTYPLKIKAIDNAIYSIIIRKESDDYLVSQMNYLIKYNINKSTTYNIFHYPGKDANYLHYIGISPFDSEIEVIKYNNLSNTSTNLVQKENYFQDINYVYSVPSILEKYNITPKNPNSGDYLLIRFSLFRTIKDKNGYDSIILPYNYIYPFIFNKNMSFAKFTYLHPDNAKGLSLTVEASNEAEYSLNLYINGGIYNSRTIKGNDEINIESEILKDKQSSLYQPIKIDFLISAGNNTKDELVKLKIKEFTPKKDNKKDDKTKKLILIIGCSAIGVLVIVVVIVIIFLVKNKKTYDKLKDQVNSISFKKDEALQRDSKDDDLLE
jgi:hypothetical protein